MRQPPMVKWGLDPTKAPAPVRASSEPIIRFFSYHDAHPVAFMLVLLKEFGVEWFEWEPETLKTEIIKSFNATSISEHNWEKIQALRTLTSAEVFWEDWEAFEKIIQSLNNNLPLFDVAQKCTIGQLMAGVDMVTHIRVEEYDDEIKRYISACALDHGVLYLPPPLDFAQQTLAEPRLKCNDCGTDETNDLDGKCSYCCGRFHDGRPLNMKPAPFLPANAGTNVTKYLKREYEPAAKRFDELREQVNRTGDPGVLDQDSPEDVQAAKLMVGYQYMKLRQRQLVEQLEELEKWAK